ncbi:beta,beta-carotene 9',10'-oxygenase [Platysternon megacephalum]|uniref:Beta,beta-carotene 9',10'-oxygenase n=1 Tax=Platysternon megacephalum TaxID=55544 RepID=A0A4D9DW55_9SAUR|nr:beta,beta-carotene 9',10'-oxygenase [Platysternon megacephalum]
MSPCPSSAVMSSMGTAAEGPLWAVSICQLKHCPAPYMPPHTSVLAPWGGCQFAKQPQSTSNERKPPTHLLAPLKSLVSWALQFQNQGISKWPPTCNAALTMGPNKELEEKAALGSAGGWLATSSQEAMNQW